MMGTLLSILGSIGIISNGAGATVSATTMENNIDLVMEDVIFKPAITSDCIVEILIKHLKFLAEQNLSGAEQVVYSLANYLKVTLPEGLDTSSEIIEYFESIATQIETLGVADVVEGGILAGSLGTAAETFGISLVIGAAIYGGYYTYQHWDSVKHFASETLKTTEQYVSLATNYLKSWWPF